MTQIDAPRRGFSLVEMLCVCGLLVLVIGMVSLLLTDTLNVERSQRNSFDRMLQQQTLADQFRADVGQAEQAPPDWQNYKSGPDTLILQMKKGGHVLYSWRGGNLERRDFEDGVDQAHPLSLDADLVGVEFLRDGIGSKMVRLRLSTLRDGKKVPGQTLEFAAALGGDWR